MAAMPPLSWLTTLSILILIASIALHAHRPSSYDQDSSQETLHMRTYFYVGGRYVNVTTPRYGTGPVLTEQTYVEKLTPANRTRPYPIIFWTGLGQSGANWLNTPSGAPGWASYFLSQGYTVYLADQPIRARSPFLPTPYNDTDTAQSVITSTYAWQFWTATQHLRNPPWPQARLHTQWPVTGLPDDHIFESFIAALVPSLFNQTLAEHLSRSALSALLQKVSPAILLAHSAGGPHAFAAADTQPHLVRALVAIEPQGPPFVNAVIRSSGPGVVRAYGVTQTAITYDPPISSPEDLMTVTIPRSNANVSDCVLQAAPARRLPNIARVPVLLVTSEAGYHAVYDYCTVEYLRQAGVAVEWMDLPRRGIRGNGHFMFMERNSEVIAGMIRRWVERW